MDINDDSKIAKVLDGCKSSVINRDDRIIVNFVRSWLEYQFSFLYAAYKSELLCSFRKSVNYGLDVL